jgi:deazaflavin-dependent oxidoreductase (nitroreductase family)
LQRGPDRPWPLRLLALAQRAAHRVSGGRLGSTEPARAAPRGRALQIITAVHHRLYRWTDGIVGGDLPGLTTLLLTTTGRKTGLPRTVPLPWFPHPEGFLIVASFAGNPKNPAWYDNLVADPRVEIQVKARRFRGLATPAGPDERPALWASIVATAPMYADYQRVTPREIPVVILREIREGTPFRGVTRQDSSDPRKISP